MHSRAVLLFLFAACATTSSNAAENEPSSSPKRCLSPESAEAERARLVRWNEQQLRAALALRGLELVNLAGGPTRFGEGEKLRPNLVPAVVAPWTAYTDAEGRVLIAEPVEKYMHCGVNSAPTLRFVRDANQRIYLLAHTEESASIRNLRVCACGGFNMPGCGAAGYYVQQRTWVLPPGSSWGGEQKITSRAVEVYLQWERPKDCVAPTPMP